MKLLFVADPLESFKTYKDSTFAMMREAARRGHELFACEPEDLMWQRGGRVSAPLRAFTLTGTASNDPNAWFAPRGERGQLRVALLEPVVFVAGQRERAQGRADPAAALPHQVLGFTGQQFVAARGGLAHHREGRILVGLELLERVGDEEQFHDRITQERGAATVAQKARARRRPRPRTPSRCRPGSGR